MSDCCSVLTTGIERRVQKMIDRILWKLDRIIPELDRLHCVELGVLDLIIGPGENGCSAASRICLAPASHESSTSAAVIGAGQLAVTRRCISSPTSRRNLLVGENPFKDVSPLNARGIILGPSTNALHVERERRSLLPDDPIRQPQKNLILNTV